MSSNNEVMIKLTATQQGLLEVIDKMNAKLGETPKKLKETKDITEKVGEQFTRDITRMVLGYTSLRTAINFVNEGLKSQIELSTRLANKMSEGAPSYGVLGQLVSNPSDRPRIQREVRLALSQGSATSISQAANMVYGLDAAGVSNPQLYRDLSSSQLFADVIATAGQVKGFQRAFGGRAGSDVAVLSGVAAAGKYTSRHRTEQLLDVVTRMSPDAEMLGLSPAETMASSAIFSSVFGDRAGEVGASLFRGLNKAGMKGKSLREMVMSSTFDTDSIKILQETLGEATAAAGVKTMRKNAGQLGKIIADIEGAQKSGFIYQQMDENSKDPIVRANRARRIAEGEDAIHTMDAGAQAQIMEAIRVQRRTNIDRVYAKHPYYRTLQHGLAYLADMTTSDATDIAEVARGPQSGVDWSIWGVTNDLLTQVRDHVAALQEQGEVEQQNRQRDRGARQQAVPAKEQ